MSRDRRNANRDMRGVNVAITSITLACILGLLAKADETEEPAAPFQVTTRKGEDRVTARLQGDRWVFMVTSPSGIGGARLTRKADRWTRPLVLRLRLRGLERLQAGNGTMLVTASVSSNGDHRIIQSLVEEGRDPVPIDRSSPFWTEIRILDTEGKPAREILSKDGTFEVALPQALFASNPAGINVDWIDFYR